MGNNTWFNSLSPAEKETYRLKHNAQLRGRYAADASLRIKKKEEGFQQYRRKREEVIQHLGGRCSAPDCLWINGDGSRGCTDSRCLQIDHVLGDGAVRRKESSEHGTVFYRKILRSAPGQYQLLCANCNWIKRSVNQELPQARALDDSYVFIDKRKSRIKDDLGRFAAAGV
jgi:hypothetical protein